MNKLVISPSPHVSSGASTQKLMRDVLIALIPALACSVAVYGLQALITVMFSVASCVFFEYVIQRFLLKAKTSICDLSAVVTGVLLGFNLPSSLPFWMIAVGALVSIGVAKMSFGGLGRNIFNPALVGRVFLLISFTGPMTAFKEVPDFLIGTAQSDAFSGATILSYLKEGINAQASVSSLLSSVPNLTSELFFGSRTGSIGEIGTFALLIGFVYMLIKKVISWHIPVFVLGSMFVFSGILHLVDPEIYYSPFIHIFAGGAILGAVFMATDYVTSPMNHLSMAIYAIGIGVITILIRVWGKFPEGMSFAILIMNSTVPLLNKYIKPKHF